MAAVKKSAVPIAVLCSGSGSNLQALLDADLGPGKIALVLCNVPGARALERAKTANVETMVLDHRVFDSRVSFDQAVVTELKKRKIEWVVLAGFMRIVTRIVLEAFPDRVVNIHPALLPAFPGIHAQKQALHAGVKLTGCSVHLVDEGTDTGPVLAQSAVPVLADDDEPRLSNRILAEEHRLYPKVVRALAEGKLRIDKTLAKKRAFLEGYVP